MKKIIGWAVLLIIAGVVQGFLHSDIAQAGNNVWSSNGPFGGTIRALSIDPLNSSTIYAGTSYKGVFKSTDGGRTWTAMNNGLISLYSGAVFTIAIDPLNSDTIYLGATGCKGSLFKSTDGGSSWIAMNRGLETKNIVTLAIDPLNTTTIYAGTGCDGGGVFKSSDGGNSWTAMNNGLNHLDVQVIAVDFLNPNTIYAGTWSGVSKSIDGGSSWTTSGITKFAVYDLEIDTKNTSIIYAGTYCGGGAFKSTNGGLSWTAINSGLTNSNVHDLAIDPLNTSTIYAANNDGLFKSTDGGNFWTALNSGMSDLSISDLAIDPQDSNNIYASTDPSQGVFKSTDGGSSWTIMPVLMTVDYCSSLVVDPINSNTIYVGTFLNGVFKSTDNGNSWYAVNSGLTDVDVCALSIDSQDTSTIYAGTYFNGVYKSKDGGSSWGIKMSEEYIFSLAVDPTNSRIIYAGTGEHGIFKSIDGGNSWSEMTGGLKGVGVRTFAIDPQNTSTIYAGFDHRGVFKSTNGGRSWTQKMAGDDIQTLAIDPLNSKTIYSGWWGGMFKSTNGGRSWAPMDNGLTDVWVNTIAINPFKSSTIYAGTDGGVFKSTDGGNSWTAMNIGLTDLAVAALAIDPGNPSTIYAGTVHGGVFSYTEGTADDITMLVPYPPYEPNDPSDTRTPLILVHGIHGTEDLDKNGRLDDWEAVEQPAGWERFLEYFDSNSELNNKYKIFRFLYLSDLQPVTEIGRSFRNHLNMAINRGDMNDLPVVLLAHSMGGLVSRSLMQEYNGSSKIKKLITLATPHHGSPGTNDTNALRKLFTGGPRGDWHFLFAEIQLVYNLVSTADGSRWDVMMDSDHPNRSDLRWDNKAGSVLVGARDANGWLAGLNDSLKKNMAQKIITYSGYVDSQTHCRKSWSSPLKIHLKTNLMPFYDDHKKLCIAGAIMDAGMNYAFLANDGMVPIQSARLYGHKVAKRVTCADHDHLDMLEDPEKECSTKKRLFESLKDDLLDIAESP